jgi:lysophospholipase L1-like esterase
VLTPVPRGPFAELPAFSVAQRAAFPEMMVNRTVLSLPQQTFEFLEKPDYYFDAFHLNAKGRQRFTEKLVTELVSQLGAAGQHASYP